jgi:hypothetical protein
MDQEGIGYEGVKSKFLILYSDHWWDLSKADFKMGAEFI